MATLDLACPPPSSHLARVPGSFFEGRCLRRDHGTVSGSFLHGSLRPSFPAGTFPPGDIVGFSSTGVESYGPLCFFVACGLGNWYLRARLNGYPPSIIGWVHIVYNFIACSLAFALANEIVKESDRGRN